jgi:hypothetical protein
VQHEIVVLYDIARGIATARYRNADGDIKMLGDADDALTAIVSAYVDPGQRTRPTAGRPGPSRHA